MFALLLLFFVVRALALSSLCPDVKPVENFDLSRIGRGKWYEVARYPCPGTKPSNCESYIATMKGDLFIAETDHVNRSSRHFAEVRTKMIPDDKKSANLSFTLLSGDSRVVIESKELYILAVDYDNYFIPYTCIYNEATNDVIELVWIISKTKPIPGKSRKEFMKIAKRVCNVDENKLIWIDHENCDN